MLSRILALTLSLGLLVPPGRSEVKVSPSAQVEEEPEIGAAKEKPTGSAANSVAPSTQAGETREKQPTQQSAAAAGSGSPQALSQEEAASLSARDEEPGPEVSGGALSNLHLTYAVIALAAILLVLLLK